MIKLFDENKKTFQMGKEGEEGGEGEGRRGGEGGEGGRKKVGEEGWVERPKEPISRERMAVMLQQYDRERGIERGCR